MVKKKRFHSQIVFIASTENAILIAVAFYSGPASFFYKLQALRPGNRCYFGLILSPTLICRCLVVAHFILGQSEKEKGPFGLISFAENVSSNYGEAVLFFAATL